MMIRAAAARTAVALQQQLARDATRICVRLQCARVHSKNPFEIHFHADAEDALRTRNAKRAPTAVTAKETALHDDIRMLHAEMADIFGEELEEYDDGSSNSSSSSTFGGSESQSHFAQDAGFTPVSASDARVDAPRFARRALKNDPKHSVITPPPSPRTIDPRARGATEVSVLVLEGPCSYLRGASVSAHKPKHEVLSEVHRAAAELGASVICRDSNLEGEILEWLLAADPANPIVLCWNARLSESPMVLRALELLDADVIVVSPLGVEHGPLPASVRGVITGMGAKRLEVALEAAAALLRDRHE